MRERDTGLNDTNERLSRRQRVKQILGRVAVVLTIAAASATYSVTHASVEDTLGPHRAIYEPNDTGMLIADFGPLGTARHTAEGILPAPLEFFHLGITVTVGEIPEDAPVGNKPIDNIANLSADMQSYVQFYTHPEVTINNVTSELLTDITEHTLLYTGEASAGLAASYLLLGKRRRQEIKEQLQKNQKTKLTAFGLVGLGLTSCISGSSVQATEMPASIGDSVFDNTPLHGTEVTGRLGTLVEVYGGQIVDYVKQDEATYARIADNVTEALKDFSVPGGNPEDKIIILVVSDLHCNVGMAQAIHAALVATKADIYIDSGDTVMSGTEVEKYCIQAFSNAVPDGVAKVVAPGNHDSDTTIQQEKDNNFIVLDGKVVKVKNVNIIGDKDSYFNALGQPVQHVTNETTVQLGHRLADTACNDPTSPVNLLIIHRPEAADESVRRGCVDTAMSGHKHQESGPTESNEGTIRYTSGTTGGASENLLTVGTNLGTAADISVWVLDKKTNKAINQLTISVSVAGAATTSDWVNLGANRLLVAAGK